MPPDFGTRGPTGFVDADLLDAPETLAAANTTSTEARRVLATTIATPYPCL